MLNKIKGMLESAFDAFLSDSSQLKKGLQGLGLINPDFPNRVSRFIVTGEDETILLDLSKAAPNAGRLLGNPGRLNGVFYANYPNKAEGEAAKASLASRSTFYTEVENQPAQREMLVRLGKVFEAADQGNALVRTGAPVPDWLQYLFSDALWTTFSNYRPVVNEKNRPAWDVILVHQLLELENQPGDLSLQLVFERKGVDAYYQEHCYSRLLAPGVLDQYMLDHADAVRKLLTQLSAVGRALLANRIGAGKGLADAFGDVLVRLAVDSSKTVRAAATKHLVSIPLERRLTILSSLLTDGTTDERCHAADMLAHAQGAESVSILEQALDSDPSKTVQQAIRNALSRLQAAEDAGTLELPPAPPWEALEDALLGEDAVTLLMANRVELLEKNRKAAENEVEQNKTRQYQSNWAGRHYKEYTTLTDAELKTAVRALNGLGSKDDLRVLARGPVQQTMSFGNRLESLPQFGINHLIRWLGSSQRGMMQFWYDQRFQKWLQRQDPTKIDLRMFADLLGRAGFSPFNVAICCLRETWWQAVPRPMDALLADRIWPFFVEHPEFIGRGLGLSAATQDQPGDMHLGSTLEVLATFPVLPAQWLPRLMELALGEGKTYRASAQKVLKKLPDIGKRVVEALASSKQEIRSEAARWLADLEYRDAVPDVRQALDKETRETVRAALLTTLEHLGEDISARLAPGVLLAEAQKGLKAKAPSGLSWFAWEALPACRWRDASAVQPEIVRWWVILACKLKEPGGNALLQRYLQLLDQPSRAALGSVVLRQFIAWDTLNPSLEQGIAHAQAHAPHRYQQYQDWAKRHPQYYEAQGKLTPEQVFEQVKREKMSEYLGSAIGEKGILALAHGAPGHEAVSMLQAYMRDHYQRRSQIEAMVEAIAVADDPIVIQMLLGLSRRYRTASVQEKARTLVDEVARRNGWSQNQLADRTIPTAGFDDQGRLDIQYGERQFTVTLDDAMKPVLKNSDGKIVKALPEARQNDAPESIKEAKALFSTCKKELKQVIDMQTVRLYESMCAGRLWPVGEWRDFLYRHPIVGRLVQRLVWTELTPDGQPVRLLRPTEDGSLIDVEDNEVELADAGVLRLAHGSIVSDDVANAWIAHLKDYKVTPLFAQMTRKLPDLAVLQAGAARVDYAGNPVHEIADRLGWLSDSFTLRGALTKLGYQRAPAEDGGFFYQYTKDFGSAAVRVAIEFSGNTLPEENVTAALKTLSFEKLNTRSYNQRSIALKDVPPVLLAEAYADYHTAAAACSGFDAAWEKKIPW
jgi:hypothetical protein